jgi:hypothetical protein
MIRTCELPEIVWITPWTMGREHVKLEQPGSPGAMPTVEHDGVRAPTSTSRRKESVSI